MPWRSAVPTTRTRVNEAASGNSKLSSRAARRRSCNLIPTVCLTFFGCCIAQLHESVKAFISNEKITSKVVFMAIREEEETEIKNCGNSSSEHRVFFLCFRYQFFLSGFGEGRPLIASEHAQSLGVEFCFHQAS